MRHRYAFPVLVLKAFRAAADLGAARIALRSIKPQDVLEQNRRIGEQTLRTPDDEYAENICDEAAFFIGRMADRMPWRSDCLVQALAGQSWLARRGYASEIIIGVAMRLDGSLEAHAWLRHGDRVVLGGDITTFQPLNDPSPLFKQS